MSPSQIRSYSRSYSCQNNDSADIFELIQSIPTLTKIGAVCLVLGKFMGIMAIPAAFIPSLNILVIPLIFAWGSLVFCAIALCSVDHFKKKRVESRKQTVTDITALLQGSSALSEEETLEELGQEVLESAVIIPFAVGQR
ncbi:MAG: hypothetical protein JXR80_05005 [Deltaproteobacteria bacterium]|nr:hypothetical protein [Deltaproteobacteria bacterium]